MTALDLDTLEATANAATPGPWIAGCPHPFTPGAQVKLYGPNWTPIRIEESSGRYVRPTRDAAYIATFDPPTALALIARVREAEAALERVWELHREGDWECGNPSHTNPEVGCPDCWVACASCQESYPCPTIRTLEGASS